MMNSLWVLIVLFIGSAIIAASGQSGGYKNAPNEYQNFTVKKIVMGTERIFIKCKDDNILTVNTGNETYRKFNAAYEILEINCKQISSETVISDVLKSLNITVNEIIFVSLTSQLTKSQMQGLKIKKLKFAKTEFNFTSDLIHDLQIRKLSMHRLKNYPVIPEGFLKRSEDLEELEFGGTDLKKISRDDFSSLKKLISLRLLVNKQLSEVQETAFDSLSSLKTLKISSSNLSTLPDQLFKKLKNLEELVLSYNRFDNLPERLLDTESKKFMKFEMSHNNGKFSLPPEFFKKSTSLTEINLKENKFESIPEDLFRENKLLFTLDLSHNSLKNLPSKLFANATNMGHVDLSNNQLTSIPEKLFDDLNLCGLDISYNQLTELSSNIEIPYLRELTVSHNNLTKVDTNFCRKAIALRSLDLSHNSLTLEQQADGKGGSRDLSNCGKLTHLNLSHNKIKHFPYFEEVEFDQLERKKRILELEYNQIEEINCNIKNYYCNDNENKNFHISLRGESLSKLYLNSSCNSDGDEYDPYEDESEENECESEISIKDSEITCDCNIIDFLNYMRTRDKRSIKITHYNVTCKSSPHMTNKTLATINVTTLFCERTGNECPAGCTCRDFTAKNYLDINCSYKGADTFNESFWSWSYLHNRSIRLNLSSNGLESIPNFDHIQSVMKVTFLNDVTHLDLSNNKIQEVNKSKLLGQLRRLKLHGNEITRLDKNVVSNISELTLHDNPWVCSCDTISFIEFIKSHPKKYIHYLEKIKCDRTKEAVSVHSDYELCKKPYIIMVIIFLVLVAITGILTAYYYKNQQTIKIWLYSKGLCLCLVAEDDLDAEKKFDAFISFAHKDQEFVKKFIIDRLEQGPEPYKLCLHYRDWLAGEWIPNQINWSVKESRRTIVVLTPNFIESEWAQEEFRAAYQLALTERRRRIIVIVKDVKNLADPRLGQEFKNYLKMNTYISWDDSWAWDILTYALPHKRGKKYRRRSLRLNGNQMEHIPLQTDDQSETHTNKSNEDGSAESQILLRGESAVPV